MMTGMMRVKLTFENFSSPGGRKCRVMLIIFLPFCFEFLATKTQLESKCERQSDERHR
jgi:hypothetical protein